MDKDKLQEIINWANRGTLNQFKIEVDARLMGKNYESELEGSSLTFYRVRKEGGILGIGGKQVREPVLTLQAENDMTTVDDDSPADPEFVAMLGDELNEH